MSRPFVYHPIKGENRLILIRRNLDAGLEQIGDSQDAEGLAGEFYARLRREDNISEGSLLLRGGGPTSDEISIHDEPNRTQHRVVYNLPGDLASSGYVGKPLDPGERSLFETELCEISADYLTIPDSVDEALGHIRNE